MTMRRVLAFLFVTCLFLSVLPAGLAEEQMPYAIGVDLTNQVVTVYDAATGEIVRQMISSCGAKNTPTVTGTFTMPKRRNPMDRTKWYDFKRGGFAHYASRIFEGYMFHSYLYNSKREGSVIKKTIAFLGIPVSHGCIRMHPVDAEWIARNCLPGTKVKIYHSGVRDEYLRAILKRRSFVAAEGVSYIAFVGGAADDEEVAYGSNAEIVRKLQNRLLGLGLYSGEITGVYNLEMMENVATLQEALGLPATGRVGKGLWDLLFSDDAPTSGLATTGLGAHGPMVAYTQALLKKAALYTGEINGVFDADTDAAVRKYQNFVGFPVDGVLTDEQRLRLIDMIGELQVRFPDGYELRAWSDPIPMATVSIKIRLNVRKEPSKKSKSLGQLHPQDAVHVLEKDGEWTKISYEDLTGYVLSECIEEYNDYEYHLDYVSNPDPELIAFDERAWAVQPLLTCVDVPVGVGKSGDNMIFYAKRSLDSDIVFGLLEGSTFDLEELEGNWARCTYCGMTGYINTRELTLTTRRALSTAAPEGEAEASAGVNRSGRDVKVYENVSTNSAVLGTLPDGAEVEITLQGDTWSQIRFGDGMGFVENASLEPGTISPALRVYRESVIDYLSRTGSIEGASPADNTSAIVAAIRAEESIPEVNLDAEDADDVEEYIPWGNVGDDFTGSGEAEDLADVDFNGGFAGNDDFIGAEDFDDEAAGASESEDIAEDDAEIDTSSARAIFDAADQEYGD